MATITVSPNGRNLYDHHGAATELLVGTADGIVAFNRADASAPWQESQSCWATSTGSAARRAPPAMARSTSCTSSSNAAAACSRASGEGS